MDANSAYKIELPTALKRLGEISNSVDSPLTQNCWRKTGLVRYPDLGYDVDELTRKQYSLHCISLV